MQVVKERRLSYVGDLESMEYEKMYRELWWVSVKELFLCGIYGNMRR